MILDVDAALRRLLEGIQGLVVGDEIGVRHVDRALGKGDGGHVDDEGEAVVLPRGVADHLHQRVPLFFQHREIDPVQEFRAHLFLPGVNKEPLEFGHRGALDLNVGVAPGQRRPRGRFPSGEPGGVDRTDVDAAGDGHPAVGDQDLAVVRMRQEAISCGS